MSKATDKALADLHGELAKVLAKAIQPATDAEGNSLPPSPAILNVARQFLKDNKIEAVLVKGSPLEQLHDALPEFDDEPGESLNYQ